MSTAEREGELVSRNRETTERERGHSPMDTILEREL